MTHVHEITWWILHCRRQGNEKVISEIYSKTRDKLQIYSRSITRVGEYHRTKLDKGLNDQVEEEVLKILLKRLNDSKT